MDTRVSSFTIPFYTTLQGIYAVFSFKLFKFYIFFYLYSRWECYLYIHFFCWKKLIRCINIFDFKSNQVIVIACVFLTNYSGNSLSVGDYIVLVIMTSILCLCLPSVPSSSIVTILVVANSINMNSLNIGLLYTGNI